MTIKNSQVEVVLVDDEPVSRLAVKLSLNALHPRAHLRTYDCPKTCIQYLRAKKHLPHLLMLSCDLPNQQVNQLAIELMQMPHIPRQTPIVALSKQALLNPKNSLFDAVYQKPITMNLLDDILQTHLTYKLYNCMIKQPSQQEAILEH